MVTIQIICILNHFEHATIRYRKFKKNKRERERERAREREREKEREQQKNNDTKLVAFRAE